MVMRLQTARARAVTAAGCRNPLLLEPPRSPSANLRSAGSAEEQNDNLKRVVVPADCVHGLKQ